MMNPITLERQHARMAAALRAIVGKAHAFEGDTEEREQDDLEDAFSNGIDVGRHDALVDCAKLARAALHGVPRDAQPSTVGILVRALRDLRNNVERDLSGWWTESTSNFMQQADEALRKVRVR